MSKKFQLPKEIAETSEEASLKTPECADCLRSITDRINGAIDYFETHANEVFDDFYKRASDSLEATAKKTDRTVQQHLTRQEIKEDAAMSEHFEKQSIKYDNFEKKIMGLIWKIFIFFFGVITLCSGIVAATWITVQDKAEKKEVMLLNDAKQLEKLRNAYTDKRYVLNSKQTIDQYNYEWLVETIFEHGVRSATPVTKK